MILDWTKPQAFIATLPPEERASYAARESARFAINCSDHASVTMDHPCFTAVKVIKFNSATGEVTISVGGREIVARISGEETKR